MASAGNDNTHVENQLMLRTICHDIANSVSIILTASLQYLQSPNLNEAKRRDLVQRINQAARVQRDVIGNMKALTAYISGEEHPAPTDVSVREAVEKASILLAAPMESKGIRIKCDFPAQDTIWTDRASFIYVVMNNLLSNAVKFSPREATIVIGLTREPTTTTIAIKDHGVGLALDAVDGLYQFKHKAIRSGTEGEFGIGLGLPLVKYFLDQAGATIRIDSPTSQSNDAGDGTTVYVTFPNRPR